MATSNKGGTWGTTAVSEEVLAGSTVSATYSPVGSASAPLTETKPATSVRIALAPTNALPAVPGSVVFGWMGQDYSDNGQGLIFRGATPSSPGIQSGTMDYAACVAVLDDWVVGPNPGTITRKRLWVRRQRWTSGVIYGRTSSAPVRPGPGGFVLSAVATDGELLIADVSTTGAIGGDHALGGMDFATGAYQVMWGDFVLDTALTAAEKAEWWYNAAEIGQVQAGKVWRPRAVDPTSLRYNAVTYIYLPIDAELLGLTPERLRADGKAPWVRPGDFAVVGLTITGSAFAPTVGMTYNVGHTLLSSIDVLDASGTGQVATGYTQDLDAGTLQITDITGWPAEVIVRGRAEVYRRVARAEISGDVTFTMPIGRAFPAGAVLSTAVRFGNKQAFVARMFDQNTWTGTTWSDILVGSPATGTYNDTANPIEVNNRGTVTERWALKFRTDGITFDLIGEHLGQIASGTVNADFAPPNAQADNAPYLVVRAAGWGSGWVPGNVLFIHTTGAEMSVGVIRSTSPGSPSALDYEALFEIRGDKDRPPSNPFA
ncbi:MAG: hypothetical protein Q8S71_11955 [Hydrogenophaga sp.]|nr:hypothetical protein [Hydrogenophaga sp.]